MAEFLEAGLENCGENYVQEALKKIGELEKYAVNWHFIGALQSNKAREAVRHFALIHSVDRISLAKELDKEAAKIGKIQPVLLQINLGHENSKAGCAPENAAQLLENCRKLKNLEVQGLMSLPPYFPEKEKMRPFHAQLRLLRDGLDANLPILSMGMSNDFEIAIEEGANLVRIGTALFGERS